jgi:hypothetical protein
MIAIVIILLLNSCVINADEHQSSIEERLSNIEMTLEQLAADLKSKVRNEDSISMVIKRIEIKVSLLSEKATKDISELQIQFKELNKKSKKNILEIKDALQNQANEFKEKLQYQQNKINENTKEEFSEIKDALKNQAYEIDEKFQAQQKELTAKESNLNNKIDAIKNKDLTEIKNECYINLQKHRNETEHVLVVIKNELKNFADKLNKLIEIRLIPTRLSL